MENGDLRQPLLRARARTTTPNKRHENRHSSLTRTSSFPTLRALESRRLGERTAACAFASQIRLTLEGWKSLSCGNAAGCETLTESSEAPLVEDLAGPVRQSNSEAMVNLLNNCLGSGLLGVAFAFKNTGLLIGILTLAASAMLNMSTLFLNRSTCEISGADPSTTEMLEKVFGVPGRATMVIAYTLLGFFCMVSYVAATRDALVGFVELLMPMASVPEGQIAIVGWLVFLIPPTFVRSPRGVAVLSLAAFSGGIILLLTVSARCAMLLHVAGGLPAMADISWLPKDGKALLTGAPILFMILSVQAGGGIILATMRDTSANNVRCVTGGSYSLVFAMELVMGVVPYLTFLEETQGNVLANLPATDAITNVARMAVLVLVVLSYVVMIIPCKVSLIEIIFNRNEAFLEASLPQFFGVTMGLNIAALLTALAVPDLGLLLALNGAVSTNLVAFIIPAAAFLETRRRFCQVPWFIARNVPFLLLFLFGVANLVLGTAQVLANMRNLATNGDF